MSLSGKKYVLIFNIYWRHHHNFTLQFINMKHDRSGIANG